MNYSSASSANILANIAQQDIQTLRLGKLHSVIYIDKCVQQFDYQD